MLYLSLLHLLIDKRTKHTTIQVGRNEEGGGLD